MGRIETDSRRLHPLHDRLLPRSECAPIRCHQRQRCLESFQEGTMASRRAEHFRPPEFDLVAGRLGRPPMDSRGVSRQRVGCVRGAPLRAGGVLAKSATPISEGALPAQKGVLDQRDFKSVKAVWESRKRIGKSATPAHTGGGWYEPGCNTTALD